MKVLLLLFLAVLIPQASLQGTQGGVTSGANNLKTRLDTLIQDYSLLERDSENSQRRLIVSQFRDCLEQLRQSNNSWIGSEALLSQLILSVYKTRTHAIKYALSSDHLTVRQDQFEFISAGSADLLTAFLTFKESEESEVGGTNKEMGGAESIAPLDMAVKLGMFDVLRILIGHGVRVCPSLHPLRCTDALHYATMNQDTPTLGYLVEVIQSELAGSGWSKTLQMCNLLTKDERTFGKSPLSIAHFQCSSGLNCDAFEHLLRLSEEFCGGNYTLDSYPYEPGLCAVDCSATGSLSPCVSTERGCGLMEGGQDQSLGVNTARWCDCMESGRGCRLGSSGSGHWRVYGKHRVGRMDCDLPCVAAGSVTPEEFQRHFVELR